jgi:hypothetical protein
MFLEINHLEIDFCKPPQIVSAKVPGAECRVPKPGTRNSELRTWYLRLDKDIYQKCENEIFWSSQIFVPSAKC